MHCNLDDWNPSSQRATGRYKTIIHINKNLDHLQHRCREEFDGLKYAGKSFTLDQLVSKLKGTEAAPTTIVQYLQIKVEELKGRVHIDITKATLQKYTRRITHLKLSRQCCLKLSDQ